MTNLLHRIFSLAIPLIFLGGLLVINRSRGGMSGPAGGPMQMGKAKDKFQEVCRSLLLLTGRLVDGAGM